MINANELRLGNWIWLVYAPYGAEQSREYKQVDLEEMRRASGVMSVNSFYHEPIELNPEILEACGFVKDGSWYSHPKIKFFTLASIGEGYILKSTWKGSPGSTYNSSVNSVRYKFLHQLQNLFFALTSSELEVNIKEVV